MGNLLAKSVKKSFLVIFIFSKMKFAGSLMQKHTSFLLKIGPVFWELVTHC